MPTAADIKTQILAYLNRAGDTSLLETSWFEFAHKEIQRRHNFKIMETSLTFTLVAGTSHYNFPALDDFGNSITYMKDFKWLAHSWTTEPKRKYHYAPAIDVIELRRRYDGVTIVYNEEPELPRFTVDITTIDIWPIPTAASVAIENAITVYGWRFVPAPTGVTSDWFTDNASDYILYRSLIESVPYLSQPPERVEYWIQAIERALKDIVAHDDSSYMANTFRPKG